MPGSNSEANIAYYFPYDPVGSLHPYGEREPAHEPGKAFITNIPRGATGKPKRVFPFHP